MKKSAGILVRASSQGGPQLAPSLFRFLIFLIFSGENWCENAFRPPQPTRLLGSRMGCGLTIKARSEAEAVDARVVSI